MYMYMFMLVPQFCQLFATPLDCSQPDSSVHPKSPGKSSGVGYTSFSGGSSGLAVEFRSSALQADYLPSEPPGKPGDSYS